MLLLLEDADAPDATRTLWRLESMAARLERVHFTTRNWSAVVAAAVEPARSSASAISCFDSMRAVSITPLFCDHLIKITAERTYN